MLKISLCLVIISSMIPCNATRHQLISHEMPYDTICSMVGIWIASWLRPPRGEAGMCRCFKVHNRLSHAIPWGTCYVFSGTLLWNLTAKGGLICPSDVLHTVELFKQDAIAVSDSLVLMYVRLMRDGVRSQCDYEEISLRLSDLHMTLWLLVGKGDGWPAGARCLPWHKQSLFSSLRQHECRIRCCGVTRQETRDIDDENGYVSMKPEPVEQSETGPVIWMIFSGLDMQICCDTCMVC